MGSRRMGNPPAETHPHPNLLARFGRGRPQRRRNREIVRHLLTDCEDCRRVTSGLLPPASAMGETEESAPAREGGRPAAYGPAFASSLREVERRQAALKAEQAASHGLLKELLALPVEFQGERAAAEPRYHTWALCALVLDNAKDWGFQDPRTALKLSRLGTELAEHLAGAVYGEPRVRDLRARAAAVLGNAQRILGDFGAAETSFSRAEQLLKSGTGDLVEKAHVLLLKASLRGTQQRFRDAFHLLDRVMSLGHRCGDSHLCGKAMITRGFLLGLANDPEAAIRHLTEGLRKVDPETDPRLVIVAQHNLTLYLAEAGRYMEALRLLEDARPRYDQVGEQMGLLRLRLRWLEGKIASALGHFSEAESFLRGVQKELIDRELGYDAALLSLDLADIYARQGRSTEMRRLAEEMLPIFKSRDIHREAIAALFVFQKAAEMERVTLGLIRDVTGYLKESRASSSHRSREAR
jgi:tetratricopeptide (TPR) repeat protein